MEGGHITPPLYESLKDFFASVKINCTLPLYMVHKPWPVLCYNLEMSSGYFSLKRRICDIKKCQLTHFKVARKCYIWSGFFSYQYMTKFMKRSGNLGIFFPADLVTVIKFS